MWCTPHLVLPNDRWVEHVDLQQRYEDYYYPASYNKFIISHMYCHRVVLSVKYKFPSSSKSRSLGNIIGTPSISLKTTSASPPSVPTLMMPMYASAIHRSPVSLWNRSPNGRPHTFSWAKIGAGGHAVDLVEDDQR